MNDVFRRKVNEGELAYIYRIGKLKDDGIITETWTEIAKVINQLFRDPDEEYTESVYRKRYSLIKQAYEQIFSDCRDNDEYLQELTLQKQEIQKERRKLYDERLDLNKRLREEARLETTIDRLKSSLSDIADKYFPADDLSPWDDSYQTWNNKMIVCLSDLHIGQSFDNPDGKYNTGIAKDRLDRYLQEASIIAKNNNCNECYVCLLGDLISGSIHHRISVTNRENVVDQVKEASMMVSGFIDKLSARFAHISVYSVGGNHSRIEKNAEDALLNERLDDLIPWIVKEMLANNKRVEVFGNTFDPTLGVFSIGEETYFIQHGDYTRTNDAEIGKLVLWAKQTPYCILTGHMHYPAMMDVSGITVIQSGSLCGSGDDYTRSKRLTGRPSQTVVVTKPNGRIHGVFPVDLCCY